MKTDRENIALKVKDVVKENGKKFNSEELKTFELAIQEFEDMVNKGLVRKRGYTLITIEEKHLKNTQYSSNFQ